MYSDSYYFIFQLKLLSMLSSASLTPVTVDQVDTRVSHICGKRTTEFYNVV